MKGYFERGITGVALVIAPVCLLLAAGEATAWTSARLARVDTTLEVAFEGPSRIHTEARYEIAGGKLHGFDLVPLPGADLVPEECEARLDDGRRLPLSFRGLHDGRTRVVLADGASLGRGAVTFHLEHRSDLVASGSLRRYEGRARLDWTPIVWDESADSMVVGVHLPLNGADGLIAVDPDVSSNYEVAVEDGEVSMTKHRAVRWYPMQVVVDFDPGLVASLGPEVAPPDPVDLPTAAATASVSAPPAAPAPAHVALLPAAACLIGLLALLVKASALRRSLGDLGLPVRFRLLPRTGPVFRFTLSLASVGLGLGVQHAGHLAAGIPAVAAAAALWLVRREEGSLRPRPGGTWRTMEDSDVSECRRLAAAYQRRRRSVVDITAVRGAIAFLAFLSGLGYAAATAAEGWPEIAWAAVIDGLLLAVPAWFSHVRSELPVDPMLEGFSTLRRWRSGLARLVGAADPDAKAALWLREDDRGPVEVRLRVEPPPAGLKGLEVAGEVVRAGSTLRTRRVVVLRLEPGTEAARRLASCPHAAEHHLTPDLEDEIIVLRNRRGRSDAGFAPLRAALALLHT